MIDVQATFIRPGGAAITPVRRASAVYETQAAQAPKPPRTEGAGDMAPLQESASHRREKGFRFGPLGLFLTTEVEFPDEARLVEEAGKRVATERGRLFKDAMDVAEVARALATGHGPAMSGNPQGATSRTAVDTVLRAYERAGSSLSFQPPGGMLSRHA